jgi:hypothetical protein
MVGSLVTFRSAPLALRTLVKLRHEVKTAKSFEQLKKAARDSAAIQRRFKPVKQVADEAGRVRSEADRKLASELAQLKKATGTLESVQVAVVSLAVPKENRQ